MLTSRTLVLALLLFAANDPFSGTWKLNPAKSKLPSPAPQSIVSHIDADSDSIRIREEFVDEKGQKYIVTVEAKFDGKDYPINGSPFADAVSYRRLARRTIEGVAKKAGKVILRESVVVSADGRTLTGTYSSTDAKGEPLTGFAVFDKQ